MMSLSGALWHSRRYDWPEVSSPPDPAETPEYIEAMAQAVEARERAERIIRTMQQSTGPAHSRVLVIPERS